MRTFYDILYRFIYCHPCQSTRFLTEQATHGDPRRNESAFWFGRVSASAGA